MKIGLAKTNCLAWLGGLCVVALFAFLGLTSKPANAVANNQTINFQGRLLNSQGAVVPDGYYNIEFKIYQDGDGQSANDSTGSPSGSLKWTEDWLNSGSHGVKVVNGFMSVQLGSITAFGSNIDWSQGTLWLSMQVGDTSSCTITINFHSNCSGDGEMLPMQPLTASPYSLNSGELGGLTSNNFVQLAQGVQTDNSTSSSIFINKTGASGSILELQKGGVDVMNASNTGTVLFQPSADSTTALQVKNHANSYSVFTVDTTGNGIVLGQASSLTGKLQFATAGGGTLTINPTSGASSNTITFPAENGTVCTTATTGTCNTAGGLSNVAYLNQNQTFTGTNTFAPTTNISSAIVKQSSTGTPTNDIFDIQGANGTSNFLQVTSTAANQGAINLQSFGSGNDLTLNSGSGTVKFGTGTSAVQFTNSGTATLDATSGQELDVGAAANAHTTKLGSATGAATTTIQSGTGGVNINPNGGSNTGVLVKPVNDSTAGFQVQNAASSKSVLAVDTTNGQLVLGTASSGGVTGKIKLLNNTSGSTGSITLQAADPTTNNYTITIPAETGTICTTAASAACTAVYAAVGGSVLLAPNNGTSATAQADATNYNSIFINKTSGTGNILELQKSGSDVFKVDNTGNVTSTGQNTLNRNGSGASDYTLGVTGTTAANNNSSLVRIGGALTGGNSNTNGGTYLSIVEPSSGAGSAADFFNLQNGTTVEMQLTAGGNLTVNGTYDTNTFNSNTLGFGGNSAVTINSSGSNNITLDTGSSGGILALGNNAATTNLGTSNAAHTIGIGTGGGGTTTQAVTIGAATNSSSTLTLQGGNGTGAISLLTGNNGSVAGSIQIGNTSGAFTQTISIGNNNAAANTVQIGTGTSQESVTIGDNTNANSSVAIKAGSTGGISLGANTTLSANSNLTYASGTGGFDAHNASGTFQTSTGANSLNGATTVTGTNTFTVNGGKTTLNGATAGSGVAAQVNTNAASNVGLVVQGTSGQTAQLLQLQDSTGSALLGVAADGDLDTVGNLNTPYGGVGSYGNLLLQSEQLGTSWTATNITVTQNDGASNPAPDGNTTADKLVSTASGTHTLTQTHSSAGNNTYTFSIWLKTATPPQPIQLRIDSNGTPGTGTAASFNLTGNWQRYMVTQTFSSGVTTITPTLVMTNNSASIVGWGAQLVQGASAGVYIRTGGATVAASSGIVSNQSAVFQALTNSASAYQFLNSSAQNVATIDTSNGQLVLGTASTGGVTGKIKLFNNTSGSTGSITLQAADPTTNNYTITIPAETGTICTTAASAACTAVYAAAGGGYVNFAPNNGTSATAQTDATNYNSIFINKTSGTGNIFELQKSGSDVFKVDNTGNVTSTGQNTLSRNGVGSNDYTLGVTGTTSATGSSSLVRIGNALTGGNGAANGGTYLSIVEPGSGAGSAADFFNLQNGTTVEMQLTAGGNLTVNGTYDTNTFNSNTLGFGGNSAVTINSSGSNNITVDTGSSGGIESLGNNASTTNIGTSNAAHTIAIGTGTGGTTTQAVTVGSNTNGSSTLTLQGGNGTNSILLQTGNNGSVAGSIQIGNTSGAFTQTVSIATNNAAANTVQIGTGTSQESVTIGDNTNANSSVSIKAGSTGGISLGASTTLSANSSLTFASGTGAFDAHNASGTFQTSSGANSLNGATTVTGTNTFTVNGGATTLKGATAGSGVAATVNTNAASNVGLVVQGASSQSAALLQLQDSSGASVVTNDVTGDQEQLGYLNTPYGGIGNYGNLILQSEQLGTTWTATNITVTQNDGASNPAPDGSTTADKLVSSASGTHTLTQTYSSAGNNTYTFSIWLKTVSPPQAIQLRIDSNGTPGTGTAASFNVQSTWQRYAVTQTFTSGVTTITPTLVMVNNNAAIVGWGAQLIQSATAGVYAPTATATVAGNTGIIDNGNAIFQTGSNSTTAYQFQNASGVNVAAVDTNNGQLVLGTAGASGLNGQIQFNTSGQTGSITLASANPSSSTYTITLPAETGTVCTTAATGACSVAGSGYVQLAPNNGTSATVQTDATNYNSIYINKTSGTGNIFELQKSGTDVIKVDNTGNLTEAQQGTFSRNGAGSNDYTLGVTGTTSATGTSSLVRIGAALTGGNGAANGGTYLSIVEPSSGAGSAADFFNLQNGTTVESELTSGGNLTIHGTYNGNTFTSSALQFSAASSASLQPAASQALNITGHATSTWSLDAGNLTLQTSAAASTLTIDAGTSGSGTITVGTNANSISLGTGTTNQNINIGSSSGNETVNIANTTGSNTIAIGTSSSATNTITIGTGNNSSTTTINAGTGGINLNPNGSSSTGVLVKPTNNSTLAFQVQPSASSTAVFSVDTSGSVVTVTSGVSNFSGLKFTNLTSSNSGGSQYTGILGLDTSGNVGLSQASVSLTSPALAYWDGLHDPTTGNQSYPLATMSGSGTGTAGGSCSTGSWAPKFVSGSGVELTTACGNQSGSINWSFSQVPFEETQFQFKADCVGGTPTTSCGADSTWFYSYANSVPTDEYGNAGVFTKGYLIYFSEYHGCVGIAYGSYSDGNQCSSGGGTSPLTSAHISNINDGNFHDVDIELLDNQIIVRWDGAVVLSYTDSYGRDLTNLDFGFGSRTGGSFDNHYIKGLLVTKLGTNTSQYNIDGTSPLANGLTWDNNTSQGVPNSAGVTSGFLGINAVSPQANLQVDQSSSGSNALTVNGFDYATGTVCQMTSSACSSSGTPPTATASTDVWGTGTTFTSAMVGDKITFANGVTDTVASYVSATHITVSTSRVVFSGPYRLNDSNTLTVTGSAITANASLTVNSTTIVNSTLTVNGATSLEGTTNIGSSTTDGTANLLILDSYNNATDPTGTNGAMYYNTADNAFRCYQNSKWSNCVGMWVTLMKTADQSKTSTTTLANDNTLAFSMAASSNYSIRCQIYYNTGATPDFKWATTGPSTPSSVDTFRYSYIPGVTTTTGLSDVAVNTAATASTSDAGSGGDGYVSINTQWNNGTNAGTWAFQWAQNTSNATATIVRQGSYCDYASF